MHVGMHVIGTAGHVDHGKSTLVERLTGIDPDRFEEEKRRGLTIDLGFAWLTLPSGAEAGIVDVPGHERFIKNMLAGAGGISVCLFVVAATEGWMPQSAEHLAILDVLGVRHGVVALTKADAVDDETLELARAEVEEHLAPSSLAGVPIIPCSGTTGQGLDALVAALDRVLSEAPIPQDLGRPRLWLDRVFTIAGAGTVVTGTLASGSLRTGAEVELAPHGRRARIRSIQSHKKRVQEIAPGNRTALNLAGLERTGAERGDAIILPSTYAITDRVDVWLRALPQKLTGYETEISDRGAHLLHVGSAELPVRIKLIGSDLLQNGDEGAAQLYLRSPLPLERGDRFVIRDAGRALTVGGGTVLDPLPPYARKTDAGHVRVLETLRRAHPEEALTALVNEMGEIPVEEARLRTRTDSAPGAIRLGPLLVSSARLDDLTKRLHAALSGYHASNPLERGMPRETARAFTGLPPEAFDAFLALDRQVVAEAATVRLESHTAALDPVQEKARAELIARIDAAGFTPPFEKELGADAALLRALVAKGDLVKIADFYLTQRQTEAARAKVRAFIAERGPATVAEIRDLLGTSRKYAVPLCEWLDREGITRRKGDKRALGPRA